MTGLATLPGNTMTTLTIHQGEATDILPRYRGQAALLYCDLLFGTGEVWTTKAGRLTAKGEPAFDDRFPSREAFREYLLTLMIASRYALAPHGALVVHCDLRFQPIVREIGESLFTGQGGFTDQIVWAYRRWGTQASRCNRSHDYLIRFVVDRREARWTQLYQPLAPSTVATWGTRAQKAVIGEDGARVRSIVTVEESPGAPLNDVWSDIGVIAPSSRERTGFPTQKPVRLLKRVVKAFSLPGDLVIDPTMGSGTAGEAALSLGRRFVGIDRSPVAVRVAQARLGSPPALEAAA